MSVEPLLERQQLAPQRLDGLEPPDPQQLLLGTPASPIPAPALAPAPCAKALAQLYPDTRRQRCWVQKAANVLN
ncbi:MAG: hypothetical protein ACQETK_09820, partial [Pseudomonadota bacterium]